MKALTISMVVLLISVACTILAQDDERKFLKKSVPILSELIGRDKWKGGSTGSETGDKLQVVEQKKEDIKYLTIHNFGSPPDKELIRMESNKDMHVKKLYGDIAYHYIVGASGGVYEGRRATLAPASYTYYLNEKQLKTKVKEIKKGKVILREDFRVWAETRVPGNVKGHLTVSFMCGGRVKNGQLIEHPELLSKHAMNRAAHLIAELLVKYDLKPKDVRAHREFAETNCPNDEIYKWLRGRSMSKTGQGEGMQIIKREYERLVRNKK